MSYVLLYSSNKKYYTGSDVTISSSTGVIETNNLDMFTTTPLIIAVTVSNSNL